MILPGEIQKKANQAGVRDTQMEKDYILSWLLQGLANNPELRSILPFKGGTVLKKIYFTDYRFSEDLDFTLIDESISNKQIIERFDFVFEYVLEEANISLEIIDDNVYQDGSINFYISYIGPLGGKGNQKRVKVDISRSEICAFEPVAQPALLFYSDQSEHELMCYPLEEVLVEKMRSVMQRLQARDIYDIWYLLEMKQMNPLYYLKEFQKKCEDKGLNPSDFSTVLDSKLLQYRARWEGSLGEQIRVLPEFDSVERELLRHVRSIDF